MRETGSAPAETLMVGDTSYDMAMARAAGVARDRRRLGLSSGRSCSRRPAREPILERFEQLLELRREAPRDEALLPGGRRSPPGGARSPRPARRPADAHPGQAAAGRADRARSPRRSRTNGGRRARPSGRMRCRSRGSRAPRIDRMPAQRAGRDRGGDRLRRHRPAVLPRRRAVRAGRSASSTRWQPMLDWAAETYGVEARRDHLDPAGRPARGRARAPARRRSRSWATGRWSACTRRPRRSARWSSGSGLLRGRLDAEAGARGEPAGRAVRDRALGQRRRDRAPPPTPCAATSAARRAFSRACITLTALKPRTRELCPESPRCLRRPRASVKDAP